MTFLEWTFFTFLGRKRKHLSLVILSPVQCPLGFLHAFHCYFFLPHKTILLALPIPTLFFPLTSKHLLRGALSLPHCFRVKGKILGWDLCVICGSCAHMSTQLHGQFLVSRARGMFFLRAEPGLRRRPAEQEHSWESSCTR